MPPINHSARATMLCPSQAHNTGHFTVFNEPAVASVCLGSGGEVLTAALLMGSLHHD